jgi:hypothetical protein
MMCHFEESTMNTENYIPVGTEVMGELALACPVCGFEYVHPVGLECHSAGNSAAHVSISADGVAIDPRRGRVGRGTQITLKFICEEGHAFEYTLRFHKGNTLVSRFMTDLPRQLEQWPATIWRD